MMERNAMKMNRFWVTAMVLAAVFCGMVAEGAEADNPPLRSRQIKYVPEHPRTYLTRNSYGQFYGSFVGGTRTRCKIKVKRGDEYDIIELPVFYLGAGPAFEYLSYSAKIPEKLTEYYDIKPGKRLLVHVKADDLPLGELKEWKNTGDLEGGFFPMNVPPKVEEFKGRRGVRFDPGLGKIAKIDHNTLAANFAVDKYLGYGAPFTFSAWVYCEGNEAKVDPETGKVIPVKGIESQSSIFAWGGIKGAQQTCLRLASSDVAGMSWTPEGGPGGAEDWKLVTYTYTGGDDGVFTTYVNGAFFSEQKYDVKVERLAPTNITATSATLNGELFTRDGEDGSLIVMWGFDDWYNWYQRRHVYWDAIDNVPTVKPGKFTHELTGLYPGRKYYFRYGTQKGTRFSQSYGSMNEHRFSYGPGVFVTASEDGKTPGRVLPEDTRNFFFIGGDRTSRWFMNSPGPSFVFNGLISEIKLYDYAMDFFEVRASLGLPNAYSPSPKDGSDFSERKLPLSWKPGMKDVASYRVFFGTDKKAVEEGTATKYQTKEPELVIEDYPFGVPQYWRVEQLDKSGKVLAKGDTWMFRGLYGMCQVPIPASGSTVNCNHGLVWDPKADIKVPFLTRIYLEDSLEKLEKAVAEEKPYREEMGRDKSWKTFPTMDKMRPGSTMYWKVDLVVYEPDSEAVAEKYKEDKNRKYDKTDRVVNRVIRGPIWNFHVENYYTPEVDTVYGKPPYDHDYRGPLGSGMRQCEERVGYRSRSVSFAPLMVLRDDMAKGISRALRKSRKISDSTLANRGSKVGHWLNLAEPGRGIDSMAYGGLSTGPGLHDPNFYANTMTMHEFGHHMHGISWQGIPGLRAKTMKVYDSNIDTNLGLGGYGGSNLGEDMAMGLHEMLCSQRRDAYYQSRPRLYDVFRTFVAGDRYIDLSARSGADVNGDGALTRWTNAGGLTIDDRSPGVHTYLYAEGTEGYFTPVGSPIKAIQSGVPAMQFDGKAALQWNLKTKWALYDNREFSAQYWVKADKGISKDAVLAAIAGEDGQPFAFRWGDFPGAKTDEWQLLTFIYEGGGESRQEAGKIRIFIAEKEVATSNEKFDLPHAGTISIAGTITGTDKPTVTDGFVGDIAHLRIYSYDISEDQVIEYYREELPTYQWKNDEIAGKLYVDIDCRRYIDNPQHRHEPFYPENQRMPWLRSWPNFGTLGGRMHNDIDTEWGYSGSTPMVYEIDGATVPVFMGKDRMVSGFTPTQEMVENPPRTLEVWVKRDENKTRFKDLKQVALEWGDFELTDQMLDKVGVNPDGTWHHVVLVFPEPKGTLPPRFLNFQDYYAVRKGELMPGLSEKLDDTKAQIEAFKKIEQDPAKVYVDGKLAGELNAGLLMPGDFRRMHFGGHYDVVHWNWKYMFHGAFSSVRVHQGALSEAQIQANAAKKPQDLPNPEPELIFEVNAAKLPDGKLDKWDFTGSGGGTFVEGKPEKKAVPMTGEHVGVVGLKCGTLESLHSTFEAPKSISDGGPFTIVIHFARSVGSGRTPFVSWDDNSFQTGGAGMWSSFFNGKEMYTDPRWEEGTPPRMRDFQMKMPGKVHDPKQGARKDSFWPASNYNETAVLSWIWKTAAMRYDGKSLKYYVDGKLLLERETTLASNTGNPAKNETFNEFVRLGGVTDGDGYGIVYLNEIEMYDKAFDAKELEARTRVKDPKALPGKPLVEVDFGKLKPDTEIERIKNTGTLGGEFLSDEEHAKLQKHVEIDRKPTVETVDGIRAVKFDGKDEFMKSLNVYPRDVFASYPFTFEAFVKVAPQGRGGLLSEFGVNNGQLSVGGMTRYSREGRHGGGNPQPRATSNDPRWVHLAFVFEGQRKPSRVYVDGKMIDENYFSVWCVWPAQLMTLGKEFNGDIARLRMWRGIMSEAEIAKLAKEALGGVKQAGDTK